MRKLASQSKESVKVIIGFIEQVKNIAENQRVNAENITAKGNSLAMVAEETSASTEESAAAAEEQASSMEHSKYILLPICIYLNFSSRKKDKN